MKFKVILALAASLTAFHAMADCLGDICTGERVINGYNEVSTVLAIDSSENKVVTKNNSGTLKSYSSSELSDEISSNTLPSGKVVIDEYNIIGTVNVVFRNGKIVYRRNGYSADTIGNNLSPEITENGNLRAGTRIIDEYNIRGEVSRLFQNNSTFYRRDGYSSDTLTANPRNLVLRTDRHGNLSKETLVIDEYNIPGSVTDIYADGRIYYRRNGYSSDTLTSSPKNLVLKVSSVGNLSEGSSIIDEYNITGRVTNLYQDGRVFYRRNGYSSDTITQNNKLVLEVSNLGDIKQNTFGIDSYNITGRVSNLFADGRMMFKRDGYSSANVVTEIHEEVESHKVYSKSIRYASAYNKIGNPSNFFSNGMVLLSGNVVNELYESVEQYEGLTKDSELVSILGKTSKAKEIFANGVVSLDDKNSTVSKIVIYKNLKEKEALHSMLTRLLLMKVQNEKDESTLTVALSSAEAAIVKEDLISYVKKADDFRFDKEAKKQILALLGAVVLPGDADIKDPEEYSLSVTPADIIDDVKAILDQDQKKYVFVSPAAAKAARKSIIIDISKGLLKATCSVVIKERNVEIKNVSKKIGKKDTEECLAEIKE
jgi:hypothetical protein